MVESLYWEANSAFQPIDKRDLDAQFRADYATKTFEEHVKERHELSSSYCSSLFVTTITTICCCFKSCLVKSKFLNARIKKHKKFELALERLSKE